MSVTTEPLHLSLYLEPGNEVDDDELDCITRRLMAEEQTLGVESVEGRAKSLVVRQLTKIGYQVRLVH
jgi:hypothetical protein